MLATVQVTHPIEYSSGTGSGARPISTSERCESQPQRLPQFFNLADRCACWHSIRATLRDQAGCLRRDRASHMRDGKITEFWTSTTDPQASIDFWA